MNNKERYSLHTITRANGIVQCTDHKVPRKSPVRSDKDPEWLIDIHARERNGEPFVCADMHASLDELAKVLALWIMPTFKRMGFSPSEFLRRMAGAIESIDRKGGLETISEK